MSTNFYWHNRCCLMCGRYDRYHIGKRSGGWQFQFRGYLPDGWDDPYDNNFQVSSWAEWQNNILNGGAIYDEYGTEYLPQEFIEIVNNLKGGKHPICDDFSYNHNGRKEQTDNEGNAFFFSEFS